MVAQCMENNRTEPFTCSCKWIREGAQKHCYLYISAFVPWILVFLVVIQERYLRFTRMLHGTYELRCVHIKYTTRNRQNRCSWFLVVVSATAFSHTLKHITDLLVIERRILLH